MGRYLGSRPLSNTAKRGVRVMLIVAGVGVVALAMGALVAVGGWGFRVKKGYDDRQAEVKMNTTHEAFYELLSGGDPTSAYGLTSDAFRRGCSPKQFQAMLDAHPRLTARHNHMHERLPELSTTAGRRTGVFADVLLDFDVPILVGDLNSNVLPNHLRTPEMMWKMSFCRVVLVERPDREWVVDEFTVEGP